MAFAAPTNPDLPQSNLLPGIYLKLDLRGSGSGLNSATKRLLLLGYKLSTGSQAQDTPIQVLSQTDANTYFGRGSDLARLYAASVAQTGGGVCDVYGCPVVEPSAGTAATRLITVAGPATSSGAINGWICGYPVSIPIANGDTANTIATNLNTAIGALLDIPFTTGVVAPTITLTYRHKGLVGNDSPIILNVVGATGVTLSPGTVTYTNSATDAGTTTIAIGGTTISATITNLDTPTVIAAALTTAINAGGYPVTATSSLGVVTLFYATDRVVNRVTGTITVGIGTTQTLACGTAGAGGGSASWTTALSNVGAQSAFPVWATSCNDGGASSSLSAMATHIETYSDGVNQKGQVLFWGSTAALATAGAIQTSTGVQSPTNSSGHYVECWQVDSPQQAHELAARVAAEVIVTDYHARNYDGVALKTRGTVPLMAPHRASRSSSADLNSAMYSYYMTPLYYDEGANQIKIVRGRTCSTSSDQRLWDIGVIRTLDYHRYDLNIFLGTRFAGKVLKPNGTPRTPNTITIDSVKDAIRERMTTWDSADLFDDAASLYSSVSVSQDQTVPTRLNVGVPLRPPIPLHQIAGVVALV